MAEISDNNTATSAEQPAVSRKKPDLTVDSNAPPINTFSNTTTPSSTQSTPGSNNSSGTRRCAFFAQGTCRNGDQCRFSHDLSSPAIPPANFAKSSSNNNIYNMHHMGGSPAHMTRPQIMNNLQQQGGPSSHPSMMNAPPPYIVDVPPGQQVFSIDVECVATGVQHNARSVAQVALVDEWCRPIFSVLIKQDLPVLSYITELTGLTKEILEERGLPMAEAMAHLRAHLSPNALLVGQSIQKDVQWLQLAEGVDYAGVIDLSGLLRVWNSQRGQYTSFSQDHCAKVWIGIGEREKHDAVTDAAISMSLFNAYRTVQLDPVRLFHMQQNTLAAPRVPGFSSQHPVIDGCCMGNRKRCQCGASFDF